MRALTRSSITVPAVMAGLLALSAAGATTSPSWRDAWAVGLMPDSSLIEHWNGTQWSVAATPSPPSAYLNFLGGAFATSKRNAWAVGTTDWQSTLIEHWNGTSWSD